MKTANLFVIGLLALTLVSESQALARAATQEDHKCVTPGDAWAPAVALTEVSAKFQGQCLDTKVFRPVQILEQNEHMIRFANFFHNNQYWVATLNKEAGSFDRSFFQVQRFPVVKGIEAAHVQLRLRLKPGSFVELQSQTAPQKTDRVRSFIFSFEAGRPKDTAYNFALGAFDNYILVGRVASSEQRQFERQTVQTEQYELKLSGDEQLGLALDGLKRSQERGTQSFYNTLKPNCTTELFDLFDQIPRLQGKFNPFLTVISVDPIARPSIDALQMRGLLQRRVQSMNEELKKSPWSQDQEQALPKNNSQELSFLPIVADRPWTLIATLPDLDRLTNGEREAILQVRRDVLQRIPLFLQGLASTVMLNGLTEENAGEILGQVFAKVQNELVISLRSLNSKLSDQRHHVGLYLVPFKTNGNAVTLESLGLPVALPFSVVDAVVDIDRPRSQEVFYHIAEGGRMAADRAAQLPTQFHLQALGLRLQLRKDDSSVTSQVLVGLKGLKKEFSMTNSQVKLKTMVIPGDGARAYRPVLLLSHHQNAFAPAQELLNLEFGAEGGIAGGLIPENFGRFQILTGFFCAVQAESVPSLVGVFGDAPLENNVVNYLLRGKPVAFSILGLRMNLRGQRIEDMNIKVATWPINCLSVDQVNNQFRDQANSMIEKYKSETDSDALIQRLLAEILK